MPKKKTAEKPFSKLGNVFNTSTKRSKSSKNIKAEHDDHDVTQNLDEKCIHDPLMKLVRIQYPGIVKNVDKAVETLGGLSSIGTAAVEHRKRLELRFHPNNKYNKPCVADKDRNPGVLIKVFKKYNSVAGCSREPDKIDETEYDYEVVGVTAMNFIFNRTCDFQFLPLVAEDFPETKQSDVDYLYDKIVPNEIPSLAWFTKKETVEQPQFYLPANFARFELSQNKLFLNTGEKFESSVRPDITPLINIRKTKRDKNQKQRAFLVNLLNPDVKIPEKPEESIMKLVKERGMMEIYRAVKKLFDERPIWSKVAVLYKVNCLGVDQSKVILPSVAYFCHAGPWRMTWIRLGYNPLKEIGSRIYQTLDYRIRAADGSTLKVNAKRNYASKTYSTSNIISHSVVKSTLDDEVETNKKKYIEERCFVLRETTIPPARQMFYQYCDIKLDEIQKMLSRLPKQPENIKYDNKNGWLPTDFTEHCREIVNRCVLRTVKEELLEDRRRLQEKTASFEDEDEVTKDKSSYCDSMINKVKKGIYKSVDVPDNEGNIPMKGDEKLMDTIDLINEETSDNEMDQINENDVINSFPERMEDSDEDETFSQSTDLDLDMEAVEEVNQMIEEMKHSSSPQPSTSQDIEAELNEVTSFLTKKGYPFMDLQ